MKLILACIAATLLFLGTVCDAAQPSGLPTQRRELQWGGGGGGSSSTKAPTAPQALTSTTTRDGWSLEVKETEVSSNVFEFKLTVDSNTWASIALAADRVDGVNRMNDAIAVIYEPGKSPDDIRIVEIEKITDTNFNSIGNTTTITSIKGEQAGGKTTLSFVASKFGSLEYTVGGDSELLVAFGEEGDNSASYHDTRRSILPFFPGSGSAGAPLSTVISLHIVCMLLAWGILVPSGVVSALLRKSNPGSSAWFSRHRAFVLSGVLLGIIGSGLVINKKIQDGTGHTDKHFIVGLAVLVLSIINVLLGIGRPHVPEPGEAKSDIRAKWEVTHRSVGSLAFLLGTLNLVFGALLVFLNPNASPKYSFFEGAAGDVDSGAFGGFLIAVAVLAFIAVCYGGYRKSVDGEEEKRLSADMA